MLREEFNAKCAELLGVESPETAKISQLVTELKDGFSNKQTEFELAAAEAKSLKQQVEDLQKANMALFLKVEVKPDTIEPAAAADEKPSFDSLFDEQGRLK